MFKNLGVHLVTLNKVTRVPRSRKNARVRSLTEKSYSSQASTNASSQVKPVLVSRLVAISARQRIEQGKLEKNVSSLARSIVELWAHSDAPIQAVDFWRANRNLGAEDPRFAPDYYRSRLGLLLGWCAVTLRRPETSGAQAGQALPIFSPIRLEAGAVAYDALKNACGGDKTAYGVLCRPIPVGIRAINLDEDYPTADPLGFRLSEYPTRGTIEVNLDGKRLAVGTNPREAIYIRHYDC
jgi:hypothetical protein